MAKVIITLEDTHDGENVVVSLDMSEARANTFGAPVLSRAVRLSQLLYSRAAREESVRGVLPCSRQPGTTTIH